ncbi:hypothetical protein Q1J61_08240 [Pseudomonas putida]|uniref:hypothetical protein n=1 Tax=Pseudomonas putida TaxID=303 RepID=UPI0034D56829
MESWIELLEWPAMAVTVVAAWCIGSHRPGRRMVGFCCFIASNILWSVWGWHAQAWALIVLQLVLCAMNLRGWRKSKRASRKAQGGADIPSYQLQPGTIRRQ